MGTKVGLWIDHRKAMIVAVTHEGEEARLVISKVEKQLRRSGDSPLLTHKDGVLVYDGKQYHSARFYPEKLLRVEVDGGIPALPPMWPGD